MNKQSCALTPIILTAMLTLSGCALEAELHYSGGSFDTYELTAADLLPLNLCCLTTLVLFAQCFIPKLRRLYTAIFAIAMEHLNITLHRDKRSSLLADYIARILFCFGLCMLPLCLFMYQDTFYPTLGGPGVFPPIVMPLFLTCFLMMVAFILMSLSFFVSWTSISRIEKASPIAVQLSQRASKT